MVRAIISVENDSDGTDYASNMPSIERLTSVRKRVWCEPGHRARMSWRHLPSFKEDAFKFKYNKSCSLLLLGVRSA